MIADANRYLSGVVGLATLRTTSQHVSALVVPQQRSPAGEGSVTPRVLAGSSGEGNLAQYV